MTGWQVLGWVGILTVSILMLSVALSIGRIFWLAADNRDRATSVFRGRGQD